jgi:hypothetical protein
MATYNNPSPYFLAGQNGMPAFATKGATPASTSWWTPTIETRNAQLDELQKMLGVSSPKLQLGQNMFQGMPSDMQSWNNRQLQSSINNSAYLGDVNRQMGLIPQLFSAYASGPGIAAAYQSSADTKKAFDLKKKSMQGLFGKTILGGAGSLLGGLMGSFGGPLGAMIGSELGGATGSIGANYL